MAEPQRPIVLAAGGTGGHFFPAEALARELLARGEAVALVTDKRGQAFGDSLPEVTVHRIRSAAPGGNLLAKMNAAWQMGLGLLGANALMRHLKPAAVVGFGGYPSVPTVYAAAQARVPVMLHEQNAVLGRANRMLAAAARRIALAVPQFASREAHHPHPPPHHPPHSHPTPQTPHHHPPPPPHPPSPRRSTARPGAPQESPSPGRAASARCSSPAPRSANPARPHSRPCSASTAASPGHSRP
ncbi:glycosyltransferase, partial [Azospirillum brasilense]|uniref:glycosyltransferase n=1 Tax=Azospirillum brasilense TaxID=192 RepID=UPI001FFECF7D